MYVYYSQLKIFTQLGFPGGSDGKESACNEGDLGLSALESLTKGK